MGLNWILLLATVFSSGPVQHGNVGNSKLLGQDSATLSGFVPVDDLSDSIVVDSGEHVVSCLTVGFRRGDWAFGVLPGFSSANRRDTRLSNSVFFSERCELLSRCSALANIDNVFSAELLSRTTPSENSEGMKGVFSHGYSFKIFQTIIVSHTVEVVYYISFWNRTTKGLPHKSMYSPRYSMAAWTRQADLRIAVPAVSEFEESPCFGASYRCEPAYSTSTRYFIGLRKFYHWFPCLFSHEPSVSRNRKGCTWV